MRKALSIIAPAGPFWRAGLKFDREARVIALDELTKDQLEKIKSEPRLSVEAAELPDDGRSGGTTGDESGKAPAKEAGGKATSGKNRK